MFFAYPGFLSVGMEDWKKIAAGNSFSSNELAEYGKAKCLKVLKNPLEEYCHDGLTALDIYCGRISASINFRNDPWEQKTL